MKRLDVGTFPIECEIDVSKDNTLFTFNLKLPNKIVNVKFSEMALHIFRIVHKALRNNIVYETYIET